MVCHVGVHAIISGDRVGPIGLNEGVCTSPLGYFDQYQDGYIVLKDGSRVEGRISLKSFDKSGRIILSSRSGTEYEIDTRSLNEWGLTQELPFSHSPMTWYDWKNKNAGRTTMRARHG